MLAQAFLHGVNANDGNPSLVSLANGLGIMADLKEFFHMNSELE